MKKKIVALFAALMMLALPASAAVGSWVDDDEIVYCGTSKVMLTVVTQAARSIDWNVNTPLREGWGTWVSDSNTGERTTTIHVGYGTASDADVRARNTSNVIPKVKSIDLWCD